MTNFWQQTSLSACERVPAKCSETFDILKAPNMALVERLGFLEGSNSFIHNIHKDKFPEKPCVSFISKISTTRSGIRKEPRRCPNNSAPWFDEVQSTSEEILQIFVLGPSILGKRQLIECAANRNLGIPTQKSIHLADTINGFLLQGVEVEINLWHVGNVINSLGILQDYNEKYKTCFMLVYDVNDCSTFHDALQWVPSLRQYVGHHVPIVLVGYEDYEEGLTSRLTPVSYADGVKAKEDLELQTYYEFSGMTGTAVREMVFEAAHIALESKVTTLDSELDESEEKIDIYVSIQKKLLECV